VYPVSVRTSRCGDTNLVRLWVRHEAPEFIAPKPPNAHPLAWAIAGRHAGSMGLSKQSVELPCIVVDGSPAAGEQHHRSHERLRDHLVHSLSMGRAWGGPLWGVQTAALPRHRHAMICSLPTAAFEWQPPLGTSAAQPQTLQPLMDGPCRASGTIAPYSLPLGSSSVLSTGQRRGQRRGAIGERV
jgi:hypothetical protein